MGKTRSKLRRLFLFVLNYPEIRQSERAMDLSYLNDIKLLLQDLVITIDGLALIEDNEVDEEDGYDRLSKKDIDGLRAMFIEMGINLAEIKSWLN